MTEKNKKLIFSYYEEQAKRLSPIQFAEKFNGQLIFWGGPPIQYHVGVTVGGATYLWYLGTATYDGYDIVREESPQ